MTAALNAFPTDSAINQPAEPALANWSILDLNIRWSHNSRFYVTVAHEGQPVLYGMGLLNDPASVELNRLREPSGRPVTIDGEHPLHVLNRDLLLATGVDANLGALWLMHQCFDRGKYRSLTQYVLGGD